MNKIVHFNILLTEFFDTLEELQPDIKNVIAFTETDTEIRFMSTGHDIAFLTYAKKELEKEIDSLLTEQYGEELVEQTST